MTIIYGISNCDSVKKAKKWFDQNNIDYQFYDVRKQPLNTETVESWVTQLGWEQVINKRSTSWKQLSQALRDSMDSSQAIEAIVEQPTLFKRPFITRDNQVVTAGFNVTEYENKLLP